MATEEKKVEGSKKNLNSKFVGFDASRAKALNLTKDGFMSVVLHKEIKLMFKAENKDIDLLEVKNGVLNGVNHIITLTRGDDIEKLESDDSKLNSDITNVAITLRVPFSKRQEMIIKSINRMVENLNSNQEDVRYKVFQKNIAILNVDQKKQSSSGAVFIKGYLAGSHETITKKIFSKDGEPTVTKTDKNTVRAQTFLSNFVWNTDESVKDIRNYSRHSLCMNRLSIYDLEDEKVITNSIPFKRSFKVIVYQITDKGQLIRNNTTISLCLNEDIKTKRKVAAGVYLENIEATKEIRCFDKDIFYENGQFLLTENEYLRIPDTVPEIDIIKNDFWMIQEDIFAGLTFNADNNQQEEKPEEKPEPKKGGKKSGKKTETAVADEQTEVDASAEEAAFNDVGSLADIDETSESEE